MKKVLWLLFAVFAEGVSSCALFDSVSDISVRLQPPHEVIVVNSARVSTLRSVDFEIHRANENISAFHFALDILAGEQETITLEDFTLQEGEQSRGNRRRPFVEHVASSRFSAILGAA
ncbi:MAG: hypothetical protein MdMp014T_2740 [Treponematales bacterium]